MKKNKNIKKIFDGACCPKFNLVGPIELNSLDLAKKIAKSQKKI